LTTLAVVTKEPMSARINQNFGLQIEWKIISYSTLIGLRQDVQSGLLHGTGGEGGGGEF